MKKFISIFIVPILVLAIALLPNIKMQATSVYASEIPHKASVLIERSSGKVLCEQNSHEHLPIASVTKLMTVLITLEKIDAGEIGLDDKIMVSSNASGMGGSQIFLDADNEYLLKDLLKSVIVASANDSSVALAEYIAGSENNFVRLMNERASELGLCDTVYSNCTGLPAPDAYSCAFDQAIILNKVLNFDIYHEFSSIWLEDFVHPSGRTTVMTNTNKLSRFYSGCIGGKTGSTNQAKYCLAVGAKRNDMELISVVLGADNSQNRFKLASDLLNFGFDNFETKTLFSSADLENKTIKIKGMDRAAHLKAEREYNLVVNKNEEINFSLNFNLPSVLNKVSENEVVGNVEIIVDGVVVDKIDILSAETHNEASIFDYIKEIVNN